MKALKYLLLLVMVCFFSACAQESDSSVPEVETTKEAVEFVNTWDQNVYMFMPADNPITTLDGLTKEDFACWGMELFGNVDSLLLILEIPRDGIRLVGDGAYNDAGDNKPKVYITWNTYEKSLIGAKRFILVADE